MTRSPSALSTRGSSALISATNSPGRNSYVDTPLVRNRGGAQSKAMAIANTLMKRGAAPEEIAQGILFLASDEESFVTGAELIIDGGFTAF
ncbi:MAG TPA: SDR family oxidoreductase [Bryobacteraceae bacterium]|nr:SDR family oxidoreductase [Bryobacteraceae bacterium]